MQSLELCNPPEKGAEGSLQKGRSWQSIGRPLVGLWSASSLTMETSMMLQKLPLASCSMQPGFIIFVHGPTTNVQQQHGISVRRQHVNGMLALIDTDGVRGVHGSRFC